LKTVAASATVQGFGSLNVTIDTIILSPPHGEALRRERLQLRRFLKEAEPSGSAAGRAADRPLQSVG
jgi:hypothetical protein